MTISRWMIAVLLLATACSSEPKADADEAICKASSRMNGALLGDVDFPRFKSEAAVLRDLVTDEGADPALAGPGLAVVLSAERIDDGREGFTRALDSMQALNNACIAAGL